VLKYSTSRDSKADATAGVVTTAARGWPLPNGFPTATDDNEND